MKYLHQLCVILAFSFAGEALQRLIPLPVPASVYGLALLFGALCCKLIAVEQIRDVGSFLISVMPVLFVPPAVGIMEQWAFIAPRLPELLLLVAASTVLTFFISGRLTQRLCSDKGGKE